MPRLEQNRPQVRSQTNPLPLVVKAANIYAKSERVLEGENNDITTPDRAIIVAKDGKRKQANCCRANMYFLLNVIEKFPMQARC